MASSAQQNYDVQHDLGTLGNCALAQSPPKTDNDTESDLCVCVCVRLQFVANNNNGSAAIELICFQLWFEISYFIYFHIHALH